MLSRQAQYVRLLDKPRLAGLVVLRTSEEGDVASRRRRHAKHSHVRFGEKILTLWVSHLSEYACSSWIFSEDDWSVEFSL